MKDLTGNVIGGYSSFILPSKDDIIIYGNTKYKVRYREIKSSQPEAIDRGTDMYACLGVNLVVVSILGGLDL